MKFVKFGIFALALGMFAASCGGGENKETPAADSAAMAPAPAPAATPAPAADTMKKDTMAAAAAAPAKDAKKEEPKKK